MVNMASKVIGLQVGFYPKVTKDDRKVLKHIKIAIYHWSKVIHNELMAHVDGGNMDVQLQEQVRLWCLGCESCTFDGRILTIGKTRYQWEDVIRVVRAKIREASLGGKWRLAAGNRFELAIRLVNK